LTLGVQGFLPPPGVLKQKNVREILKPTAWTAEYDRQGFEVLASVSFPSSKMSKTLPSIFSYKAAFRW
jgi:hypothetical protein